MDSPSKDLDALKKAYFDIVLGKGNVKLSPRSAKNLKQMLEDPGGTSVKTISELAVDFNTHRSSLTRLSQKLGHDGFPSFQAVFRRELKGKKNFYSEQVNKFVTVHGPKCLL